MSAPPAALTATLLARALVHALFTFWLLATDPAWFDIFRVGSAYALADGVLGLMTGFLLGRRKPVGAPAMLVALVFTDALLRLGAGIAIRVFPGIPDFPIVVVLFFGALGTWAAVAGAIAMGGWLLAHGRHHEQGGAVRPVYALFDPLSAAGLVALVLALYAFVMGPPTNAAELRMGGAAACGALTLVFLAAAAGAARAVRLA